MKKVFSYLFIALAVFAHANTVLAYQSPGKPTGFVNDFARIFTVEQKNSLETRVRSLEQKTGAEISVVSVSSLGDETIETFAVKLFEEWGIGKKKTDTGLLLLIAPNERKVRIEVGYGLEGTVTDAQSSVIINTIILPAFKEMKYFEGVDSALDVISGLIEGDPLVISSLSSSNNSPDYSSLFVFIVIVFVNLFSFMARSKSWWLGGVVGFALGFIFLDLTLAFVCSAVGFGIDFLLSKYGGKWFKGNHHVFFLGGGRGGGGGFGGFGGGRSGGGGSSGSW